MHETEDSNNFKTNFRGHPSEAKAHFTEPLLQCKAKC